jgi:adenylate cyclase
MTAGTEIERKFVVEQPPPDLDRCQRTTIEQGYIAIASDGTEVRIRRWSPGDASESAGDRGADGDDDLGHGAALTIKSGRGRTRLEEEILIDNDRFERLWPLTDGRRVEKTRYVIPLDAALQAELDVYSGALEGLTVAEVEFDSEKAAQEFKPPAWFDREVTDDPRYKNQRLACAGAPASTDGPDRG